MYPFLRLLYQDFRHRNDPPLGIRDIHESEHICWPWDIDLWMELNNGRTLTLYDLGRIPAARRLGLLAVMKDKGWGLTVAGSTTRYRRRVRAFEKVKMKTRGCGWDHRFFYIEQSMWKKTGDCASHVLIRSAITSTDGIVPPARLAEAMGLPEDNPPPDWAKAWIDAEAVRPWPPFQD
ncbi:acyl-CoA thioesterase [Pelagovum pacificum]|uniref:Acyl-CoA thioesterase n=1 Tax=Pelagovum pacificum TaxID=2588711 RepID=A0A5C5GGQ5_9RHOB|nr:acyl-CoA thioesterase [Pelagovum pacificum]QQA42931.1 acyl-CoA thioesterase [Pelagovum pacificum]TNY33925.1 acyl-CoA thioesterase [Pelagovum pacificum]